MGPVSFTPNAVGSTSVAVCTEASFPPLLQDHTLQHLLEGAYRMFKLFRGSYTYLTESVGLEGLKTQLSQFYNKVLHTVHTAGVSTACFVWVGPSMGWMMSMATVKNAWHSYFPQQIPHDLIDH